MALVSLLDSESESDLDWDSDSEGSPLGVGGASNRLRLFIRPVFVRSPQFSYSLTGLHSPLLRAGGSPIVFPPRPPLLLFEGPLRVCLPPRLPLPLLEGPPRLPLPLLEGPPRVLPPLDLPLVLVEGIDKVV